MSILDGLRRPRSIIQVDDSGLQTPVIVGDGIAMFPGAFTSGKFVNGFLVITKARLGVELARHDKFDSSYLDTVKFWKLRGQIVYAQAIGTHAFASLTLQDSNGTPVDKLKLEALDIGLDGNNLRGTVATGTAGRKILTIEYVPQTDGLGTKRTETFDIAEDDINENIGVINGTDGVSTKSELVKAIDPAAGSTDPLANLAQTPFAGGITPTLVPSDFTAGLTAQKTFAPTEGISKGVFAHQLIIAGGDNTIDSALEAHGDDMRTKNRPVVIIRGSQTVNADLTADLALAKTITDATQSRWLTFITQNMQRRDEKTNLITKQAGSSYVMAVAGHIGRLDFFISPAVGDDSGDDVDFRAVLEELSFATVEEDQEEYLDRRVPLLELNDAKLVFLDFLTSAAQDTPSEDFIIPRLEQKLVRRVDEVWRNGFQDGPSFRNKNITDVLLENYKEAIVDFLEAEIRPALDIPATTSLDPFVTVESPRALRIQKRVKTKISLSPALPFKFNEVEIVLS